MNLPAWPVFGFADDVRPTLRAALAAGKPAALATIVGLDGGGPRPVGTQMVVAEGFIGGFLSGGCLEGDIASHAQAVIATGRPMRLIYGRGSPWPDIRLMCGARVEILLERIAPGDAAAARLFALADNRAPALWLSDGETRVCDGLETAPAPWAGAFARISEPAPRLVVLGGDPTALAIAALGVQAGWQTTLVRPKGPTEPPPLAGVGYSRDEPAEALAAIGLDPWTAVAVASHDAELDRDALIVALPSAAFYVGALGARRRAPERRMQLVEAGLAAATIDRLRSPIGVEIGGKAPWEIAVSALAEMTTVRSAASAALEAAWRARIAAGPTLAAAG